MVLPVTDLQRVDQVIDRYRAKQSDLLQILIEAQEPEGWLPPAAITRIAQAVGLPRGRVEGVASFYAFLHLSPAGRYRVRFADNITDRMQGSLPRLARMCELLWVERGQSFELGEGLSGPAERALDGALAGARIWLESRPATGVSTRIDADRQVAAAATA